ncbi:hypothetical protein I350_02180 [Cryptococcus amylolentus CBS 6273]|uniref:Chromatin modification-related protein n=1 Tax=Cryptococcus amylolentus CBS 6273 TaxID=1296118 RepID=A0A1E3KBL0_9TREE|nr:hypothetical protein I350_02180 [Cryptococcus amylolentus CBS 6273]
MALPPSLHVHPHFNAEEAAHVVTGLISSLENLPGEVNFLLEEIREKDIRITQLIQRINSRHISLTKPIKSLSSLPPSTATFPLPIPPGAPLPTSHLTQKEAQNLTKIQTEWQQISALQDEKIHLAERLERIVNRAKERAKDHWVKVGGMSVEEVEKAANGLGEMGGGEVVLPPGGLGSGSDARAVKKRKVVAAPVSVPKVQHPALAMPPPPAPRPSLSARLSHSHAPSPVGHGSHHGPTGHSHGPGHRSSRKVSIMSDEDADGEPDDADVDMNDAGDGEGETDETLYCICQQKSYGEMIGCDNDKCVYEWFHVKCVDINGPLPETWYCPDCVSRYGFSNDKNKKSRKR